MHDDWWVSLNHGGLLIAPNRLPEYFGAPLPPLRRDQSERLRRELVRMRDDDTHLPDFLNYLFEQLLGLDSGSWLKGSEVTSSFARNSITGESVRPRRVWYGPHGVRLPVFLSDGGWGRGVARIGVGRGRRAVSRVLEWMRNADHKLALLSNGRQLRLIHAGADYDAFCEWDIELWFDEGSPTAQVTALRRLLGRAALTPPSADAPPPLLAAILDSRKGQGELSAVLGERVRLAVEELICASSAPLAKLLASSEAGRRPVSPNDIYIAATRLVMRLVVVLFAEARELLPRDNPLYHGSYGLQGLREELDRAAGGRSARLRHRFSAWPRVLGLFRLVYSGSGHEALNILGYGGGLFEPGRAEGDPVSRALSALEQADNLVADDVVHHVLELLTRTTVRLRQGRGSIMVEAPVDFSDLSSEYIGILYEGLLDYELRRAPEHEPMVFLELGDEPVLPLSRLEEMTVKDRAELLKKLRKGSAPADDDEDSDEAAVAPEEAVAADEGAPSETLAADLDAGDTLPAAALADGAASLNAVSADTDLVRITHERVATWARNAVRDAGWTKRGANLDDPDVVAKAKSLVRRIVLPGEWFLVRWGGTRKGAGTFYTRPQLAGPTTRRTLEPLAYRAVGERTDPSTGLSEVDAWVPATPEEILALKVCDPAMGSGSFLVSALRYLTDALFASLHHHGRLETRGDKTLVRLADGADWTGPTDEPLPLPLEHEDFEPRLRARLKRYVVERCLYGVDLDPVAVELARLSLWVETMDARLPFEFLDHKLKVGNALVGCWLDRFEDYPILAWERDGGDKVHRNFVHHRRLQPGRGNKPEQASGDVWTEALKRSRGDIRAELAGLLQQQTQPSFSFGIEKASAETLHGAARAALDEMHRLPVGQTAERARLYAERIRENPSLQALRRALDAWCALWFWPGDRLDDAPRPRSFVQLGKDAAQIVEKCREQHRFFHWELEFPDVFDAPGAGFDAVIGNPPWDTQKPISKEFFANHDPLYRNLGKQEALKAQTALFTAQPELEEAWIRYQARFNALSNWVKNAGEPFGDPQTAADGKGLALARGKEAEALHESWRRRRQARRGYADAAHPFRYQGSADVNTYKAFLELGHALLRSGGQLGLIVPSGLYTDLGTGALRRLFLEHSRWTHLYAFQNERFVFVGVDHRFKVVVVHVRKGGRTEVLRTRFRLGPGDSPEVHELLDDLADERGYLVQTPAQIERFSPSSRAILEIRSARDLEVLSKLYANGVLLGEQGPEGWGIRYATEFHMTNDSKLFPPRPRWEAAGYAPDEYGHWLLGPWRPVAEHGFDPARHRLDPQHGHWSVLDRPEGLVLSRDGQRAMRAAEIEDVGLPFIQGAMLQAFDCSQKGWLTGTGLRARWESIEWNDKRMSPQFLMARSAAETSDTSFWTKTVLRRIARNTDSRMLIAGFVPGFPCGDVASIVTSKDVKIRPALLAVLNSFPLDSVVRQRCGGTHVDYHYLIEMPLPRRSRANNAACDNIGNLSRRLAAAHTKFAPTWLSAERSLPWRHVWALTVHERLRLRCLVDALVAALYGLAYDDLSWILRDCDHCVAQSTSSEFARKLDPKGFWRVDKDQPPELRHPVLALVAFHELQRVGLEAFLSMNDGEGWMLPETLRLADYGLGHDERAKEPQPVAAALGRRFYDWQLAQGVDESWEECARHAVLLERIVPLPTETEPDAAPRPARRKSKQGELF
jgi:hypothetical protein